MTIIWSDEAVADYHQNIEYLLSEWSEAVAIEFINDVEAVLNLIKTHPELYPLSDFQGVRKAVFRKQITLFFKANETKIFSSGFGINYQNPQKLHL